SVSRVLTIDAGPARLAEEEDVAFRAGDALTEKVHNMVALTNAKLNAKTEKALKDIARSKNILYVLLAIVPLFALVLAIAFIRGFTTPVNRLLEATRSLKSGNLDHKVEGLKEEFGELASSFNEMADSIKEQMRRMREAEQTLEKANQELKVAQEQMVRAETMAALGTLSSGISHELSTPLSVILNMTQLMKQEVKDDPALLKDMEVVEYEANQAIKVTRSLLGFARSTKSKKERVDVNRVLEDLFKILEFQPAAKSVKLNKRLAPDLRLICADSGQIRQVFLNIILNAIQAMPDGGELDISTGRAMSEDTEGVEITIRDTGVGIPKADIADIFQPFFTTKEDGTGLGLAISYGIIKEHNGDIGVTSEVGRGTTFRIFLPEGSCPETKT
ncbi:MAG TPA: ATP-binding protein, partial [Candidatus Bathyarchaeia archaeon]|nr:ATP-binding protein [Candidatus Bathyarchaeia archaeon]